ncbi:MAG: hypothetical protein ACR2K3_06350 [Nocardioides sp.]
MPTSRCAAVALALVAAATSLTACEFYTEHLCFASQYPVYAITNHHGRDCVRDGRSPRPGFAAFPPGRVPSVVGDRYDRWPLAKSYPWRDEVDPSVIARYERWRHRHGS